MKLINRQLMFARRAVTLTEMLVVVGVVVVIFGLSLPAFEVWESGQIRNAVNQMSGLLRLRRSLLR